jgi:hypothetical protein
MVVNRSSKAKAPEPLRPTGKWGTRDELINQFKERRERTIAYVEKTQEPLRHHVSPGPFGELDAYQWILFLSGHSERHILQIQEIKARPDFPKQ